MQLQQPTLLKRYQRKLTEQANQPKDLISSFFYIEPNRIEKKLTKNSKRHLPDKRKF